MYDISYSYFIFPLLCIIPFINKQKILLSLYLIWYLGFSKVGADYGGYLVHYKQQQSGVPLKYIHGEIIFKLYMKVFVDLGFSYDFFRCFHIILFLIIIMYALNKCSENYTLSLFILYCGYIVYLVSAYRQMISMAFILIGLYLIKKNKENIAIVLNVIGIGFHMSSIYGVICFIYFKFKKSIYMMSKKNLFILLGISFILRVLMMNSTNVIYMILDIFGKGNHFLVYASEMSILPFGLLTRIIPAIMAILLYKNGNKYEDKIFFMYILSVMLFTISPFVTLSGRLFNNGRILDCLIFPIILKQQKIKFNKYFVYYFSIIYFLLMLINQLLKQGGYYPYINILFQ